jgi:hypothetical protein
MAILSMPTLAILLAALAPCCFAIRPLVKPPPTHLSDGYALLEVRAQIKANSNPVISESYASLIKAASAYVKPYASWSMNLGPWSVMNKTLSLPAGVTSHDYLSIGIYNHPCNALPKGCTPYPGGHILPPSKCDNTTGLPWEPCDGQKNSDAIAEGDSPRQSRMQDAIIKLSLAAFLCNETSSKCAAFAERAALIARTWFVDAKTFMKPELYYGQIMPSTKAPKPGHGGFIEWAHMAQLLDAILLLDHVGAANWDGATSEAMHSWVKQFLDYMNSKPAQGERNMKNNHGR